MKYISIFLKYVGIFVLFFCIGMGIGHLTRPPIVSVVMPTYNRENQLPAAIDSILNQTLSDFEFIIVDDGSTDGSWLLLQEYAKKDKRIRLIKNDQNRGIAYSRNRGNEIARGKYIAIMDSDDTSIPDRLQASVDYLEEHPNTTVVSGLKRNIKGGSPWYRSLDKNENMFEMHFDNTFGHPEAVVRRSFLTEHNIKYNEDFMSSIDYDYWVNIILAGGTIDRMNKVILNYHYHGENPYEYYVQQNRNRKIVSKRLFALYGIKWSGNTKPTCELVKKMIENNIGLVDTEYLQKRADKLCAPKKD